MTPIFTLLKQRSAQTLLLLAAYFLTAAYLPLVVHQSFYTLSLLIKDLLMWVMPITVCFFVAHTVTTFERKAPVFIVTLILFESISNMASVWYGLGFASLATGPIPNLGQAMASGTFEVLWRLPLEKPAWWAADKGVLVGLMLGCIAGFSGQLRPELRQGKKIVEWVLTKIFARLIPVFILGFAAHMHQTHLFENAVGQYGRLLSWLLVGLFIYISMLFAAGASWQTQRFLSHVRNLLPAGGIALTSGCSLSTLPWTIAGTAKNLKEPHLAEAIIPATTNIQQVGDCIANSFLCFVLYKHFYGHAPDTWMLLSFSAAFVAARFATAAVIGGAIFIMLPVYETYLHFTPDMIAIILGLNVVLDPLITSANVMANGALCRIFECVYNVVGVASGSARATFAKYYF